MTRHTHYPAYPPRLPTRVTAGDRLRGVAAALAILALAVGFPILLLMARPAVFPDWLDNLTAVKIVLLGGDLQRVLLILFYVVAWLIWLRLVWRIVAEVVVQVRDLQRPHLAPLPDGVLGRLVASVLLASISVASPAAQATGAEAVATVQDGDTGAPDAVDLPSPSDSDAVRESSPTGPPAAGGAAPVASAEMGPKAVPYVVREGDTLWDLAEKHLGNGRRFLEIFEANRDVLGPKPDYLRAGVTLRVPQAPAVQSAVATTAEGSTTHVVEPGDTLSEIALDHYGDPNRYPDIAAASASTVQPDGDRLTDPDHIEPGWTLTIPGTTAELMSDEAPAPTAGADADAYDKAAPSTDVAEPGSADDDTGGSMPDMNDVLPPALRADVLPVPPEAMGPSDTGSMLEPTRAPEVRTPPEATEPSSDNHALVPAPAPPTWFLPGLASGGALLAAGLHLWITRALNLQAQYRRPGRMVRPIPKELVPAAATAEVAGEPRVPDLERLALLLQELAGPAILDLTRRRPPLLAVELTEETAILHLAEPADLPAPWSGEGTRWQAPLEAAPAEVREMHPYPMLVTVGDDGDGHAWLLNLEQLRVVTVAGDEEQVAAFGRHLAVELAMLPWTVNLTADAIGVTPGAARLSVNQIEEHHDARAFARSAAEIRAGYDGEPNWEDFDWYHVILTGPAHAGEFADLAEAVHKDTGRNAFAIVALGEGGGVLPGERVTIRDGKVEIPALGLVLVAVHLSPEEFESAVNVAIAVRDTTDAPIPVNPDARGWAAFVDHAGGPRSELTEVRPADETVPAGPRSLLPASDAEYLAKTANTREDLERLAPVVPAPAQAGQRDEASDIVGHDDDLDPTLDADLADWADKACPRPRVAVLGPVKTWGAGSIAAASQRKAAVTAIFTFLALHPEGVIAAQVGAAIGCEPSYARTLIGNLRDWLGQRPDGGEWISKGNAGRPVTGQPPHRFRIDGCLVDADLFVRLRARAQRRGADGLPDLVTALRLARGRPMTLPERHARWHWATLHEHHNSILTAAVADVAHLVITRAVLDGDLDLAHEAHRIGTLADPIGELLKNDLVLIHFAEKNREEAQAIAARLWERIWDQNPLGEDRTAAVLERADTARDPAEG